MLPVFGNKLYKPYKPLFPTPDDIPLDSTDVTISLPFAPSWIGLWIGALLILCDPENFQEFDGGISRETAAEIFQDALFDALLTPIELAEPYWDDPEGDDAASGDDNPEYPFYENVANFVIAGFVLYAAGPGAALQYWTVSEQFRLAFRKHDVGGIIKIFMDALEIGQVDTYSATPDLAYFDVVSTGSTLRLEVSSDVNPAVTPGEQVVQIIRKRLWAQEIIGDSERWDDTCECFQSFNPFTGTWYDNPAVDPRTNVVYLLPLRTTGDVKCDAAANMVAAMEEILNQFFIFTETVQLINAIIGVIAVFQPGYGLLVALIIALITAIIEIGVASILFAFSDPEVWDTITCILYRNINSDGSITESQIADVQAEIEVEYPGSVIGLVTSLMFEFLGVVGMNNAGSTGDETGDCDECEISWTYKWDFHISDGGFTFDSEAGVSGGAGTWVGGASNGYQKTHPGIVCPQYEVSRKSTNFVIGANDHVLSMTIELDAQASQQCSHVECYIGSNRSNGLSENLRIYQATNGTSVTDTGDITNKGTVHLTFESSNTTGGGDFYSVTISGTSVGSPPAFTGGAFI